MSAAVNGSVPAVANRTRTSSSSARAARARAAAAAARLSIRAVQAFGSRTRSHPLVPCVAATDTGGQPAAIVRRVPAPSLPAELACSRVLLRVRLGVVHSIRRVHRLAVCAEPGLDEVLAAVPLAVP